MSFNVKHEEITPSTAHSYLAKSVGNRHLNADYVLSLAVAMETGKWDAEASEIVFDETGALVDGHHRLHAIIAYDKSVTMLVKRGVSKSARAVIDTGRTRTINDLFTMFRPDAGYANQRRSTLVSCVSLLAEGRRPPAIRTLDAFDAWGRVFAPGIETMIGLFGPTSKSAGGFRIGPVMGAFAFAHKTSPKKVEAFAVRVIEGLGLERNEPAATLRNLLMSERAPRGRGGDRTRLSRKVLGAIYADLKGVQWGKAQDARGPLDHFRKAYDADKIDRMMNLWTPDPAPSSIEQ